MTEEAKGTMGSATMNRASRVSALIQLGRIMEAIGAGLSWPGHSIGLAQEEYDALDGLVQHAHRANGWATEENVRHAFRAWGQSLEPASLKGWLEAYPELDGPRAKVRTVGLILAGNVPLVGLHDVLCTWLSGHRARVKCSSQEPDLIPALVGVLDHLAPGTAADILFSTQKLGSVEAVIATGSNNTTRYFEHYFGHLPRIVRKSRVSVAVLDGTESDEELAGLGEDALRYFGLGCRNVSQVHVPQDFDLDRLFGAFFPWKDIIHHNKYCNNYDYTRALWLLDQVPFLENGFLLLREAEALPSAVATLHYQRYQDISAVKRSLIDNTDGIQCIVGHGHVPFGQAQQPELQDYADGVDTLNFLLDLA